MHARLAAAALCGALVSAASVAAAQNAHPEALLVPRPGTLPVVFASATRAPVPVGVRGPHWANVRGRRFDYPTVCATPCTLYVAPGAFPFRLGDAGWVYQNTFHEVNVRGSGQRVLARPSPLLNATGITWIVGLATGAAAGGALAVYASTRSSGELLAAAGGVWGGALLGTFALAMVFERMGLARRFEASPLRSAPDDAAAASPLAF